MRTIVACLLATFPASPIAAGPAVHAHISHEDVRNVCQLITGVTAEPVRWIDPVFTRQYVPGAVTRDGMEVSAKGKKRYTLYEQPDRVSVHTGYPNRITGGAYELQKVKGAWKIVFKGTWIR